MPRAEATAQPGFEGAEWKKRMEEWGSAKGQGLRAARKVPGAASCNS